MRSQADVDAVLRLVGQGVGAATIARQLGIPRTTVRDWRDGRVPARETRPSCPICGEARPVAALPAEYVYLLGLYLGDGCLSEHRRDVFKLRLYLDVRYPGIIDSAQDAVAAVRGRDASHRRTDTACIEVYSYWKHWPCLFPQHGPGVKHERSIVLADWQRELVDRSPEPLLRGLIQSDGCRAINTGRGGWAHPRYSFSNRSADIHAIFRAACTRLGVRFTVARPYTTYVSRKADVARLDAFIGPKR